VTTQQQYQGQRISPAGLQATAGADRSLPRAPKRYGQWAGTVLFIVVVALAAGYLYTAKGGTAEVLIIDQAVPAGHTISKDDLGSAQIAGVEDAVPVADLNDVLGQRAATGLVPGQVLTHGALTTDLVPAPTERMVAVRLDAGRVPSTLDAGTVVTVLAVPPSGDAGDPAVLDNPVTLADQATVYAVEEAVDGSIVVTLLVAAEKADKIAAYSSAGRVTVVQSSVAGE
jgi:hypothetical protein